MQVGNFLNKGPVWSKILVVPLSQEDTDVPGIHTLMNGNHFGTPVNIVYF